jgi:ABC-type Fe3+ transport system permease subunit
MKKLGNRVVAVLIPCLLFFLVFAIWALTRISAYIISNDSVWIPMMKQGMLEWHLVELFHGLGFVCHIVPVLSLVVGLTLLLFYKNWFRESERNSLRVRGPLAGDSETRD